MELICTDQKAYKDMEQKELLELAHCCPDRRNQMIAGKKSWPALYHFSHIRENIASWLPFCGTEKVLEVGAQCGAVTGALCRMAAEVTALEPSGQACEINEARHKEVQNLRIINGDLESAEELLTEKFDYIFVLGALDSTPPGDTQYTDSADSCVDLLKTLKKYLQPCGKIVLATENRFGLKYWAGCAEERTGKLFEGLEGYLNTDREQGEGAALSRAFTKKELTEIINRAGEFCTTWYYPFPDNQFPMTIYSDERLPAKGELNRLECNFQRLRMDLFRESAVYDSIIDNDLYPQFANGYLVILGNRELPQTVYTKFSNERSPKFNIRTDICQTGTSGSAHSGTGKEAHYQVKKYPVGREAQAHVEQIQTAAKLLVPMYAKEGLSVNSCTADGENGGVTLEYLRGMTLEERLDQLLEEGKTGEMETLFFSLLKKIENIHQGQMFVKTPEFTEVFGDEPLGEDLPCAPISNIDFVPANIFMEENRVTVIDYEWTFHFPIPAQFLVFRMILYYLESDGKRNPGGGREFYRKAGISEEMEAVYRRMEMHFQAYMVGEHIPMLYMYEEISPGKADVKAYYQQLRESMEARILQVFYDKGSDFCEKDSVVYPMTGRGTSIVLPVEEGSRRMRLDPGEAAGGMRIVRLRWNNGEKAGFITNGFALGEGRFYFGGGDPQIILEKIPEGVKTLTLELESIKEQEAQAEFWSKFARQGAEIQHLKRELKQREQQIREMENTKVWKMYRKLKKD